MADVTAGSAARHLAVRELAPWLGLLASWAIIALALGHADAVRLFAAWTVVRSVRALTAVSVLAPLRRRLAIDGNIERQAIRAAVAAASVSLLVGLLVISAGVAGMVAGGLREFAGFTAILAAGLPARYLAPLGVKKRLFQVYGPASAWAGATLVLLAWLAGANALLFAAAFAAREWVALALAFTTAPRRRGRNSPLGELQWREIAAASAEHSRRRLTYRLAKGVLSAALGPAGTIVARGGRGLKLDRHLHRRMPQSNAALGALAVTTGGSSLAMLLLSAEPVVLVIAASLAMVAAVTINALFWSAVGGARVLEERNTHKEDEDED